MLKESTKEQPMKLLLAAILALTTITLMNLAVTPIQEALREASQQTTELP